MNDKEAFLVERMQSATKQQSDSEFRELSNVWLNRSVRYKYSYNFDWLGLPIIQYPQDMIAMQQIIFSTKPDLIIETGVARGGSLIFYSSLLELNKLCGGPPDGKVIGVDIDIRPHNREAIQQHPFAKNVELISGSSTSDDVISQITRFTEGAKTVLVCLDSNHTHDHVLDELRAYSPLVSSGSYIVVFDTLIEDMEENTYPDRPWGKSNNPMTAVHQFLDELKTVGDEKMRFEIDTEIDASLMISVAKNGYLRRV